MVQLIFLWEPYEGPVPKVRELGASSGMLGVLMERGWKHISCMGVRHMHLLHQPGLTLEILLVGFSESRKWRIFEVMVSLVSQLV
jgi:hypothetical protein